MCGQNTRRIWFFFQYIGTLFARFHVTLEKKWSVKIKVHSSDIDKGPRMGDILSQNFKRLIVFFPAILFACLAYLVSLAFAGIVTMNRFDLNFGFIAGDRLSSRHCVDVGVLRVISVILQDLEAFRSSLFTRRFPANILIGAAARRLLLLTRVWLNTSPIKSGETSSLLDAEIIYSDLT